jgi:hypothetical protein
MDVTTAYPIVVTTSAKQTKDAYRRDYDAIEGGSPMVVTTDYPIVYTDSDKASEDEYRGTYSGFIPSRSERAARKRVRRARGADRRAKGQGVFQRAGRGLKNFAQSDLGKAIAGRFLGQQPMGGEGGYGTGELPPEPVKKGLSTGAKVGIAVGGLALVGVIIYFVTKKK